MLLVSSILYGRYGGLPDEPVLGEESVSLSSLSYACVE